MQGIALRPGASTRIVVNTRRHTELKCILICLVTVLVAYMAGYMVAREQMEDEALERGFGVRLHSKLTYQWHWNNEGDSDITEDEINEMKGDGSWTNIDLLTGSRQNN